MQCRQQLEQETVKDPTTGLLGLVADLLVAAAADSPSTLLDQLLQHNRERFVVGHSAQALHQTLLYWVLLASFARRFEGSFPPHQA